MVREFYLNKDSIQPAADTGGLLAGWEPGGRESQVFLLHAASLGLGLPRWPTLELFSYLTGLWRIPPPLGVLGFGTITSFLLTLHPGNVQGTRSMTVRNGDVTSPTWGSQSSREISSHLEKSQWT